MRPLAALAAACVAAGMLGAAAGGAGYRGSARLVLPTPKEAGYAAVVASQKAKRPAGARGRGFENGWAALYARGKGGTAEQAAAVVLVYASPAAARRAWARSCARCSAPATAHGIRLKYVLGTSQGRRVLDEATTCGNLYVEAVVEGTAAAAKLATAAGAVAGRVYARAVARGMSRCAAA